MEPGAPSPTRSSNWSACCLGRAWSGAGRSRLLSANPTNRATAPLTQLLELTFGPLVVIGEEFADIPGVERVVIFGSWAERYDGAPGQPPNDIDVLIVGSPVRADIYDAADAAAARLGMQVNPALCTPEQWNAGGEALVDQIKSSPSVTVIPAAENHRRSRQRGTVAGEGRAHSVHRRQER